MFFCHFGHRPRSPADFWSRQISLLGNHGPAAKRSMNSTAQSGERVRVPRGHCWVEGDNAAVSHDSNRFGPVSTDFLSVFSSRTGPLRLAGTPRARSLARDAHHLAAQPLAPPHAGVGLPGVACSRRTSHSRRALEIQFLVPLLVLRCACAFHFHDLLLEICILCSMIEKQYSFNRSSHCLFLIISFRLFDLSSQLLVILGFAA